MEDANVDKDELGIEEKSNPDPTAGDPPESQRRWLREARDGYARLSSDFENFKRRSLAETEQLSLAKKEAFIMELLPVVDNLERALACANASGLEPFRQGVAMTFQQLQGLLQKHGLSELQCQGQTFDPLLHDAISQREDSSKAPNLVLEVLQKGYMNGSRVFRPAKVTVNAVR